MLPTEEIDYIEKLNGSVYGVRSLVAHIREQDAILAALLAKMRACVARGTGANAVEIERWIESIDTSLPPQPSPPRPRPAP